MGNVNQVVRDLCSTVGVFFYLSIAPFVRCPKVTTSRWWGASGVVELPPHSSLCMAPGSLTPGAILVLLSGGLLAAAALVALWLRRQVCRSHFTHPPIFTAQLHIFWSFSLSTYLRPATSFLLVGCPGSKILYIQITFSAFEVFFKILSSSQVSHHRSDHYAKQGVKGNL